MGKSNGENCLHPKRYCSSVIVVAGYFSRDAGRLTWPLHVLKLCRPWFQGGSLVETDGDEVARLVVKRVVASKKAQGHRVERLAYRLRD